MGRFDLPFASSESLKIEDVQPICACTHVQTLLTFVRKGNRDTLYLSGDPMKAVINSCHGRAGLCRPDPSGRGFFGITWRR